MFIDIGANLTHSSFAADLDAVLQRAAQAGVDTLVVTGCDEAHSRQAQQLTRAFPDRLYSTAGVHPHNAADCSAHTLPALEALTAAAGVVAVGECGLDFNRDFSPRKDQVYWFEAQLDLAAACQLPVFLHQRDAHGEFIRVLARYRDRLSAAVAHCFTGTGEELAANLDMDLHIGITGWICDERRGHHLRDLVGKIPGDRLMVETDAPYLLPRDLSPKPKDRRNEPMYLPHIAQVVARFRDMTLEQLARESTETARRFFGLPDHAAGSGLVDRQSGA